MHQRKRPTMNLKFGSMVSVTIAFILALTTSQSLAEFVFEIQVFSVMTSNTTDCGADESTPSCETYLSVFCLREERNITSSDTTDCPLGFANRTYYYYEPLPTRYIISEQPWRETFQLYINARDEDDRGEVDDNIDDIYINMELMADYKFPFREVYIGERGNVAVDLSIRVQCLEDYYGADCSTFCLPQDDDQVGHFVCSAEDGTIACLDGFQNPENYCMDTVASALRTASRVDTAGYVTIGIILAVSLSLNITLLFIVVVLWCKMCQKSRELSEYLQQRDKGIEMKNNAVYGLTAPSEQFRVYGQNPESETLHTAAEYDYITTNAYL